MKKDVTELKKMFFEILQNPALANTAAKFTRDSLMDDFQSSGELTNSIASNPASINQSNHQSNHQPNYNSPQQHHSQPMILSEESIQHHEEIEESLNIMDKEKELIVKALKKHKGKRRDASLDLGISERTLYRKLKEYDIDE